MQVDYSTDDIYSEYLYLPGLFKHSQNYVVIKKQKYKIKCEKKFVTEAVIHQFHVFCNMLVLMKT